MPKYGNARRWFSFLLVPVTALVWLLAIGPTVRSVAAAEGSVMATVTLGCTDSVENPTVVLRVDADNGTTVGADLTVTFSGASPETRTIPSGGSTVFGGDTGQKSIEGGHVVLSTSGTTADISYGPKTCPSGEQVYGPAELFVAPPTTQPVEASFDVPFAGCAGVRVTGSTPTDALLRVIIDGENLSTDLTAGEFDVFFGNPSQDKASVEWSVGIDDDVRSGTLFCEQESTSEETTSAVTNSETSTTPVTSETTSSTEETVSSSVGETTTSVTLTTSSGSPTSTGPAETTVTETSQVSTGQTTSTETCTEIPNQHLLTSGPYKGQCVDNEPGGWPPSDGSSSPSLPGSATSASAGSSGNPAAAESGSSGNVSGANGPPVSSGYGSGGSSGSQPAPTPAVENHSGGGYVIVGGGGGDF